MSDIVSMIPFQDRVCMNCKYIVRKHCRTGTPICTGCRNDWDGGKDKPNLFEPHEDYIRETFARCGNCKHRGTGDGTGYCAGCARRPTQDDLWEWDGEDDE